jgi:hypothetical protein
MYNEFIKTVINERNNGYFKYNKDENLFITGFRNKLIKDNEYSWDLTIYPITQSYFNKYPELNYIKDIDNKLSKEFLDLLGTKHFNEPFIYVPKGLLNNIEYEIFEKDYERPYNFNEMKKNGYDDNIIKSLMKDKIHYWRSLTGIELIHKEPSKEEQIRIWFNWQRMGYFSKTLSDMKSKSLFNMTNEDHYHKIMNNETYLNNTINFTKEELTFMKNIQSIQNFGWPIQ